MTKVKINKNYFTQETEDAIMEYNKTEDPILKSKIYSKSIDYPFFKLTQNIIHTFKFYHTEVENLEDLQHEIIIFLLSKIHLYNHRKNIQDRLVKIITKEFKEEYNGNFPEYVNQADRVTQEQINSFLKNLSVSEECMIKLKKITPPKAYSYFGTIVKRWLIIYTKKNYARKIIKIPIIVLEEDESHSYSLEESNSSSPKIEKLSLFMDLYIEYCTNNIYTLFPKEPDTQIADAILELFRKRENLDIFNKKALYIYIREIINVKTPKITKVADTLYDIFKKSYIYYLDNNIVKFN